MPGQTCERCGGATVRYQVANGERRRCTSCKADTGPIGTLAPLTTRPSKRKRRTGGRQWW